MDHETSVVEKQKPLVAFDALEAKLTAFERENANLVFNYETPQGEKEARSHIYKLRQVKGNIVKIHKDVKADILRQGRLIDERKNRLMDKVDSFINVHLEPIVQIENRRKAEEEAKLEAERLEKERREAERLEAIQKQEEENARREAELKAREEASAKAEAERQAQIKAEEERLKREREKFEAEKRAEAEAKRREEEARKQAEIDKQEALAKAEAEKQAAIEAERRKARLAAEAKAKAEAEKRAAEKAEQERLAEIERKRIADQEHRLRIQSEIYDQLAEIIPTSEVTVRVVDALVKGHIDHVTINY